MCLWCNLLALIHTRTKVWSLAKRCDKGYSYQCHQEYNVQPHHGMGLICYASLSVSNKHNQLYDKYPNHQPTHSPLPLPLFFTIRSQFTNTLLLCWYSESPISFPIPCHSHRFGNAAYRFPFCACLPSEKVHLAVSDWAPFFPHNPGHTGQLQPLISCSSIRV